MQPVVKGMYVNLSTKCRVCPQLSHASKADVRNQEAVSANKAAIASAGSGCLTRDSPIKTALAPA